MKKLAVFLAALFAIASIGLFGCKDDGNVIRVNEVTHSIFYAPLYIAINNGYFAEEDLEIKLTNGGGADTSMTALLSGEADIGLMGPEAAIYVVKENAKTKPVVFGQLTKRDGSFLVGKTQETNFDWASLVGKTIIGGRRGGMPAMTLQYIIEEVAGLTIGTGAGKVNLRTDVAFNETASVFDTTSAEYCTLFEPNASQLCAQKGYHIVESVGSASGEVPYTAFMATEKYLNKNMGKAEKFLKAVMRGYNYLKTAQPQQIAKAIAPSFSGVPTADLVTAINQYVAIDAWMSTPVMQESAFDRLQDIMINAGELDARLTFGSVVNNSIAQKVMASL